MGYYHIHASVNCWRQELSLYAQIMHMNSYISNIEQRHLLSIDGLANRLIPLSLGYVTKITGLIVYYQTLLVSCVYASCGLLDYSAVWS